MYIVSLNYLKPLEEVDRLIERHVEYLEKQYAAGYFLVSGRKEPRTGGVIIARAQSLSQLHEVLAQDPFYISGVADYTITECVPSKAANGLELLLEPAL